MSSSVCDFMWVNGIQVIEASICIFLRNYFPAYLPASVSVGGWLDRTRCLSTLIAATEVGYQTRKINYFCIQMLRHICKNCTTCSCWIFSMSCSLVAHCSTKEGKKLGKFHSKFGENYCVS